MSHKKQKAKHQTIAYCKNNSSGQEVKLQVSKVCSEKNTINTQLTLMMSNKADRHLQTGNRKLEFERQARELQQ